MTVAPWTPEERSRRTRKMEKAVLWAMAKLNARGVYIAAFFDAGDGQHFHIMDTGKIPMDKAELLKTLLASEEKLRLSGGDDIQVQ